MVFNKKKYLLFSVSVILLIGGFWLMSSSKVSESNSFYESMFNFRRIILAPLVIIFAYL
ncbi:MAG: DUF3098 domain-containing protein, partial [Prolixibacteraceae bacterium]|nr:DUF3098 domain-containing protein [Prolixibacteraceae bacterium]